jgi:hypothetical protein
MSDHERDAGWAEVYAVLPIGWVALPAVHDPEKTW